jgi:hypothetical protein
MAAAMQLPHDSNSAACLVVHYFFALGQIL